MGKQDSILEPGDFFGVISAMTGHPRMETSVAIEDATLIACKKKPVWIFDTKKHSLCHEDHPVVFQRLERL